MDWYARKPDKYEADTIGLTLAEDGAYNRLLDYYYRTEQPIPVDDKKIAAILRVGFDDWMVVKPAVVGFFREENGKYHQETCDEVLTEYHASQDRKASANRKNGKKGGRPKGSTNNKKRQTKPKDNPPENEPKPKLKPKKPTNIHTNIQTDISPPNGGGALAALDAPEETKPKTKRGTRLSKDWAPSPELRAWAGKERPDLDLERVVAGFGDYWAGVAGQRGVKLDWDATFRNWIRKEGGSNAASRRRGSNDSQAQRQTDNAAILGACGYDAGLAGDVGGGTVLHEEPGAGRVPGGDPGGTQGSGNRSGAEQPGSVRGGVAGADGLLPPVPDERGRRFDAAGGELPGTPEPSPRGPVAAGRQADDERVEISEPTEAGELQGERSAGIDGKAPAPESGTNRADENTGDPRLDVQPIPTFLRRSTA